MSINEAAIKEELQQLKDRQVFLMKQLNEGMNELKREKLEVVRNLEEVYKSKFAEFKTTISYNEETEGWYIKLPNGKTLFMVHDIHDVKEEDLDRALANLKNYLIVKDILPEFDINFISFDDDKVVLYHNKLDLEVEVSHKDDQLHFILIKFITDRFYNCDLDGKLSLEVSSDDEYPSIRFIYKFTSTLENLFSDLTTGLAALDKFPWH